METRAWILALTLAASGSFVHADSAGGFYAGTGGGSYYVDFDDIEFDESALTLRIFGGYQLNEFVSFEAGFTNLFEASGDVGNVNVDIDGTAWDVTVRPTLPLGDSIEAYGILGWMQYDFEIGADLGAVAVTEDDTESDLIYGLGAGFNVANQWQVRGEWVVADVDDADFGLLSLSLSYRFD